jgi:hypothetical protein
MEAELNDSPTARKIAAALPITTAFNTWGDEIYFSIFYDPTQVHGKITIVTPGKVPLAHAVRLLQEATRPYSHAIQVLTPYSPHAVPFAAVLTALSHPPSQPDAVVWRNSDARGPQSRPYPCEPQNASPLPPFGVDVIVDQHRERPGVPYLREQPR